MKIIQPPNPPLIVAISAWIISFIPIEIIHKLGRTVSTVAIIIWAYAELTKGVNWFRRLLGGVVLAFTAFSLFKQLE
ncbi:MAG: hypothetical protein ABIO02_04120 [Patescibacteria group bacterium]